MKKIISNKKLVLFAAFFVFAGCKSKKISESVSENDNNTDNVIKVYDWTGTYNLTDKDVIYTLKLHKRSVDGNYEMQFYNNGKDADLYKSSIYDARFDSANIYIKYLNNFSMNATPLGFKSGDTLFILQHNDGKADTAIFKAFLPKDKNWSKISSNYN